MLVSVSKNTIISAMGQLFNRVSRVVRAELNSSNGNYSQGNHLNEGTALVSGGAVAGACVGKVGILAGGAGYSLGTVSLVASGALTGAALYEALRSLIESDFSSASAAGIGAATGAATSAAIGGVGVAVGGSAVGIGMASMAAGGAVVGLGLVGLNRLLQQGVDPEKLLNRAIEQMESDLQNARQASISVLASQKRIQQQYEQVQTEIDKWQQRSQLALQEGNEYLAQEALNRKKIYSDILNSSAFQVNKEPDIVKRLKKNLTLLEEKISDAKIMRSSLEAKISAAKVEEQLKSAVDSVNTSIAISAFERMEEKILQLDAISHASAELANTDLDEPLGLLELYSEDEELEAMKKEILGMKSSIVDDGASNNLASGAIDLELKELRRKLDEL
ncbi:MAG: PspA/IM30 family protein [Thermosynechococcaceae cyanobacterium]